jgi:glutathione S-transferase
MYSDPVIAWDAMEPLTLVIGNKNYSSWSMRPWVLLRQFDIPFDEVLLKFDSPEWEREIGQRSPSGLVPVLWRGRTAIWDTLAIAETVAEWFPEKAVWPRDADARALARSACAEMHSGFRSLRSAMPMNVRASHPGKGMSAEVQKDIDRICALWRMCRARYGATGPMLFSGFSAADAMFAPVVMRFHTYAPPLPSDVQAYCAAVKSLAAVREWMQAGSAEREFVAHDEPYASSP